MSIEGAYRKYIGVVEKDISPVIEEEAKELRPLYQEGHKAGYDDGYNKGYAQGWKAGCREGHSKGYDEGYAKAIEWALKRLTEGGKE